MRSLVVVVGLVGCGFNNPGSDTDAGVGSNADGDGGTAAPCTLSALDMEAATLSGCSDAGTQDGARGVARFSNPVNVAMGASGVAYVVDFDSSKLRKVDPEGNVTTIYDAKTFNRPFGIIMARDGYLYVECDDDAAGVHGDTSGTIWKINPADPHGANGAVQVASLLTRPRGLAELSDGTLAVTDYLAMTIQIVDPRTNTNSVLAGSYGVEGHNDGHGTAATFGQPWDLVQDQGTGNLLVTEFDNNVIRSVTLNGDVSVYAGTVGQAGHKDGTLAEALFNQPKGMTIDPTNGEIYITEAGNHDVRKIAGGMVTTVAGSTMAGYADASDPIGAQYYGVEGLDIHGKTLVIADGNDGDGTAFNHVRVLTLP